MKQHIRRDILDKFLVIDLEMDLRSARADFEKKYLIAQIITLMVILVKQLSLLVWIDRHYIEN